MNNSQTLDYSAIGKRIRQRRTALEYTQIVLAEKVEISSQHMSNIENGKAKVSMELMTRIAKALNCTVDELIHGTLGNDNAYTDQVSRIIGVCDEEHKLLILEISKLIMHLTNKAGSLV